MSQEVEKLDKEDVDWLNDTKKARDITLEILRFGVSQNQMRLIISNLALELEDRDMMIGVRNITEPSEVNDDHQETKIIHPGGNEDE